MVVKIINFKIVSKFFLLLILLFAVIFINGCSNNVVNAGLDVSILPSNPEESDFQTQYSNFKLTATVSASDPNNNPVTFNFQWYKNDEIIQVATSNELAATLMGEEGHTVRGYEFKCRVTASDAQGNQFKGEAVVTMNGSSIGIERRGGRFSNFFRVYALNEGGNSSIATMKEHINCNWVSIVILYFQDSADAVSIYENTGTDQDEPSTIAESDLISQIQYAHNLGLKVMLYPEIWINGYSGPGPRDQISGSSEWFTSYQSKIEHLAEIAQTYTYSAQYYSGRIDSINWWDALDYVGVTCLFETTGKENKTLTELVNSYSSYRDIIQGVSTQFNKSVLITEIGAYSLDGCTKWGTSVTDHSNTQDVQEQADYFEAVLETFANKSWVEGIFVEDWIPTHENWYQSDPVWPINTSFIGKPAGRVIKSWYTK